MKMALEMEMKHFPKPNSLLSIKKYVYLTVISQISLHGTQFLFFYVSVISTFYALYIYVDCAWI